MLCGLEHFAEVGADKDQRLDDAIEVVRQARRANGRWHTYAGYPGRTWFRMEEPGPEQMEHGACAAGAELVGDGRLSHRWDLPHLARA